VLPVGSVLFVCIVWYLQKFTYVTLTLTIFNYNYISIFDYPNNSVTYQTCRWLGQAVSKLRVYPNPSIGQCMLTLLLQIRSQLEYAIAVWCPYKKGDISSLEKVQRRATKLIGLLEHLPYVNRRKKLKLPTLKYRRARGDMIEVFKILHGFYDDTNNITIRPHVGVATRGNKYKLYQSSVKYDLKRVVSLWNSLPDEVVDSTNTIKCLKVGLIHSGIINLLNIWDADFTGTGN
jgi:hypothetical protein